jgi:hypothetical protein
LETPVFPLHLVDEELVLPHNEVFLHAFTLECGSFFGQALNLDLQPLVLLTFLLQLRLEQGRVGTAWSRTQLLLLLLSELLQLMVPLLQLLKLNRDPLQNLLVLPDCLLHLVDLLLL